MNLAIIDVIVDEEGKGSDLVRLEECEGYAREFALEVLERLGFDKDTRERHVKELADEMWLRQHPKHGNTASKPPAPKVPVEAIRRIAVFASDCEKNFAFPDGSRPRIYADLVELSKWLSAQEEGGK